MDKSNVVGVVSPFLGLPRGLVAGAVAADEFLNLQLSLPVSTMQARADVFDYIEAFYNRTRRHSHLGGVSPEAFERASA